MPPAMKHGLNGLNEEEHTTKRAKTSASPRSQSVTPLDPNAKVPFQVGYPPINKKIISRKEQELDDYADYQVSPFISQYASKKGELDQSYTVSPAEEWGSMKKYNNFIIQKEVYKNNQFVYVRGDNTQDSTIGDPREFWIGRILQVRAKDPQHVYALVAWMYWPHELPVPKRKDYHLKDRKTGRRTYHGDYELVASNYMDILDVLSFAGKADVGHWLENDDQPGHMLYWRQTFCRETQELSKLKEHCTCGGYFNPDTPMEICEEPSCKVWLHEECIIDDVLTRTYDRLVNSATNGAGSKGKKSKTKQQTWKDKFEAVVNPPAKKADKTTITITDLRAEGARTWSERIQCPKCQTLLE